MAFVLAPSVDFWPLLTGANGTRIVLVEVGVPGVTTVAGSFPENLHAGMRLVSGNPPPVNVAPVVNAGADQTITRPASATLAGSATDDALPAPPAAITYAWSKVSGPGTVTFADATNPTTTASFSVGGTYVLRLTTSDSLLDGTDDVTITVLPEPAAWDRILFSSEVGYWTVYTPTWRGSVSDPAIGNGLLTGQFTKVGKTVFFRAVITMGGTTTFGSGYWIIGLPAALKYTPFSPTAMLVDSGTGYHFAGGLAVSTTEVILIDMATGALLDSATPFTWTVGDQVSFSGFYEEA
jgi:hypothetical protein